MLINQPQAFPLSRSQEFYSLIRLGKELVHSAKS